MAITAPTTASPSRTPAATHAPQGWFRRHIVVSAVLGLTLGVAGQFGVQLLAPGGLHGNMLERVAGTLYAAAAWVVLGFALALLGALMLRRARWAALGLSALVLGLLGFFTLGGVALRIVSGSYLTLGAVLFSMGSVEHFLHAAIDGYTGWSLILITSCVVFCGGVGRALWSAAVHPARPARRELLVALGLAVTVSAIYLGRAEHPFLRTMFVSGPLLALVSSMDTSYELDRVASQPDALGVPLAPNGPPIDSDRSWRAELAARGGPRPNVLVITLESLAPSHMSLYGYARPTTPRIDALAREGLHMTRVWTTATHSNYAQMAILSSLFPRRRQTLEMYRELDYPRVLFHDVMALLGYDTATISSQDENWQGMRRFQDTGTPTYFWAAEHHSGVKIDSGVEQYVPDDATTEQVLDWLARPRRVPWSLYLNYQGTHFPYTIAKTAPRPYLPDEPDWKRFGYLGYPESDKEVVINRYDNALSFVDQQLGRVLDAIEASGQRDDTLIVLSADHGEMFFERDLVTHGKTLNEIEARVPLIIHWPKHVLPAERDEPASHLDMMPTLLDLLALPPHPSWQGRSIKQPSPAQHPIYMNIQGLRYADALVCWPYKLILERTNKEAFLYHLGDDPHEQRNLIESHAEIAARLEDTLAKQLLAQLDYHASAAASIRAERYQPRLRPCPALP